MVITEVELGGLNSIWILSSRFEKVILNHITFSDIYRGNCADQVRASITQTRHGAPRKCEYIFYLKLKLKSTIFQLFKNIFRSFLHPQDTIQFLTTFFLLMKIFVHLKFVYIFLSTTVPVAFAAHKVAYLVYKKSKTCNNATNSTFFQPQRICFQKFYKSKRYDDDTSNNWYCSLVIIKWHWLAKFTHANFYISLNTQVRNSLDKVNSNLINSITKPTILRKQKMGRTTK